MYSCANPELMRVTKTLKRTKIRALLIRQFNQRVTGTNGRKRTDVFKFTLM